MLPVCAGRGLGFACAEWVSSLFPYRGAGGGAGGGSSGPGKLLPRGRTRLDAPAPLSGDYSPSYYLLFPLLLLLPSSSSSGPPPRSRPVPAPAAALRTRRRPLPPGPGAQVGLGHRDPGERLCRGLGLPWDGGNLSGVGRRAQRVGMLGWDAPSIILLPASSCSLHHPVPCIPGLCRVPAPQLRLGEAPGLWCPTRSRLVFFGLVWSDLALCWVCSVPVSSDGSWGG